MNARQHSDDLGFKIIHNLDISDYHSRPEISKSGLDSIDLSPAIYYARHIDPQRPAPKEKSGQLEGSLAHCAILEPETFEERYVIGPTVNRNTKEWKDFVKANADRAPIQHDQYETAIRQARSANMLPDMRDLLAEGWPEVSVFWQDEETGTQCRCRPDWVHPVGEDEAILVDVKTYSIASPHEFRKQVARKRYDVQSAYYTDGYEKATGKEVLGFIFLCVETEWPYAANAFMLDPDSVDAGRVKYRANLRTYAECMKTNSWPGYSTGIDVIRLPQWALNTEE